MGSGSGWVAVDTIDSRGQRGSNGVEIKAAVAILSETSAVEKIAAKTHKIPFSQTFTKAAISQRVAVAARPNHHHSNRLDLAHPMTPATHRKYKPPHQHAR
jgi:hypothetical protein